MAADPISLIREAWQDGQLAYMSEDATQYRFRNDVSLPKVTGDAIFSPSVLYLLNYCVCDCSEVQRGGMGKTCPHQGEHKHRVNAILSVTQDYKTAMRARGGTGEAIDLRTLVLVLRYLNQSHGEFVKNTKGSQSITYTDRKARLATYSSNESQNAVGPVAASSRRPCKIAGNAQQEVWPSCAAWLCSRACWHLTAAMLASIGQDITSRVAQ